MPFEVDYNKYKPEYKNSRFWKCKHENFTKNVAQDTGNEMKRRLFLNYLKIFSASHFFKLNPCFLWPEDN